jgi:hypothetical protein
MAANYIKALKPMFPFGPYKKWPIDQVPDKYLKKLKAEFQKSPKGLAAHADFLNELFGLKAVLTTEDTTLTTKAPALSTEAAEHNTTAQPKRICTKADFPSKKEAKFRIRAINAENALLESTEKIKQPIRAYECEKCGAWHLTSKEKPFKHKIRQKR